MELKLTDYQGRLYNEHVLTSEFNTMGNKTTVVLIKLKNGFEIVGTSACVKPSDFDETIGRHYAVVDAISKLDAFIGYHKQEASYQASKSEPTPKRTFGLKDAENITFNITVENDKSGKELADKIFAHLAKYKGTGKE